MEILSLIKTLTGYLNVWLFQNAVGVILENWTNQKLEFPAVSQEAGGESYFVVTSIHVMSILCRDRPVVSSAGYSQTHEVSINTNIGAGQSFISLSSIIRTTKSYPYNSLGLSSPPTSLAPCLSSQFYCVRLKGSGLFPQLIRVLCKISNSNLLQWI